MFNASRTEGRETPNISASSRSGGSLSPGLNSPARMEERIWSAIWDETFFGLIGLNIMLFPGNWYFQTCKIPYLRWKCKQMRRHLPCHTGQQQFSQMHHPDRRVSCRKRLLEL